MADVLRDELLNDPLGRGYSVMSDQEAATDLNTSYRTRNRTSLTGTEVYNAIDQSEWGAITVSQQDEVWNILHLGEVNPFGREAVQFQAIFGAGATLTALQAVRVESITRAVELGLGEVKSRHVGYARGS